MARQLGDIKLQGTIGNLTFYKSGKDYFVRTKGGPSREQVLKSGMFKNTRANASEFAHCSGCAKALNRAICLLCSDQPSVYRQILKLMLLLKKMDHESVWGDRKIYKSLSQKEAVVCLSNFLKKFGISVFLNGNNLQQIQLNKSEARLKKTVDIDFNTLSVFLTTREIKNTGRRLKKLHLNYQRLRTVNLFPDRIYKKQKTTKLNYDSG